MIDCRKLGNGDDGAAVYRVSEGQAHLGVVFRVSKNRWEWRANNRSGKVGSRKAAVQAVVDAFENDIVRASGDCVCVQCGKTYYKHPHSEHRDWDGYPFLHRACDGRLLKL